MVFVVRPQQKSFAFFAQKIDFMAHRQAHFGGHMPKWQTCQHRHFDLVSQPSNDCVELKAMVVLGQCVIGELTQPVFNNCVNMRSIR